MGATSTASLVECLTTVYSREMLGKYDRLAPRFYSETQRFDVPDAPKVKPGLLLTAAAVSAPGPVGRRGFLGRLAAAVVGLV